MSTAMCCFEMEIVHNETMVVMYKRSLTRARGRDCRIKNLRGLLLMKKSPKSVLEFITVSCMYGCPQYVDARLSSAPSPVTDLLRARSAIVVRRTDQTGIC